jgi:hypothetical protein
MEVQYLGKETDLIRRLWNNSTPKLANKESSNYPQELRLRNQRKRSQRLRLLLEN